MAGLTLLPFSVFAQNETVVTTPIKIIYDGVCAKTEYLRHEGIMQTFADSDHALIVKAMQEKRLIIGEVMLIVDVKERKNAIKLAEDAFRKTEKTIRNANMELVKKEKDSSRLNMKACGGDISKPKKEEIKNKNDTGWNINESKDEFMGQQTDSAKPKRNENMDEDRGGRIQQSEQEGNENKVNKDNQKPSNEDKENRPPRKEGGSTEYPQRNNPPERKQPEPRQGGGGPANALRAWLGW